MRRGLRTGVAARSVFIALLVGRLRGEDVVSKISRITHECFGGAPNRDRVRELIEDGWKIVHDRGTAYVSMRHPRGGAFSLCEVKTYGTPLTCGEADPIAAMIAEDLTQRFSESVSETTERATEHD